MFHEVHNVIFVFRSGYLYVSVKTKSPHSGLLTPVDGTCHGLDSATPSGFNTIIFLASHILFSDIIKPAWDSAG